MLKVMELSSSENVNHGETLLSTLEGIFLFELMVENFLGQNMIQSDCQHPRPYS